MLNPESLSPLERIELVRELEDEAWPHIRNGGGLSVGGSIIAIASYELSPTLWPAAVMGAAIAVAGIMQLVKGDRIHNRAEGIKNFRPRNSAFNRMPQAR